MRSVKNADGSWYRLYADGWVEQGGWFLGTASNVAKTITLPIEMIDTNYSGYGIVSCNNAGDSGNANSFRTTFIPTSTTQITLSQTNGWRTNWQVSGQSAIDMSSLQDGEKYLYFYVGAFTQTAIENTAGLNTELFNGKADLNLLNTASNIDFVVESQEPTAANGYTWYRKYKSGWVEQGGVVSSTGNVNLLVSFSNTSYQVISRNVLGITKYTTYFNINDMNYGTNSKPSSSDWMACGMAA